jgi:sulfur carrier protein
MLNIKLNGKPLELDNPVSLIELFEMKGLEPDKIVVEYNFEVLKKEDFGKVVLKENDNLEVLSFVGGG